MRAFVYFAVLTFTVTGWLAPPSDCFVPSTALVYALRLMSLNLDETVTHKEMSRDAILECILELLKDNPNDPHSLQRLNDLDDDFDESDLIRAYHGELNRCRKNALEEAIEMIEDANADVDFDEKDTAAAHFDSEAFESGQNRLVELREAVIMNIKNRNFDRARRDTGRILHTLQDFYSHSNWIEMGNMEPYSMLGRPGERLKNLASFRTPTCNDCKKLGGVSFYLKLIFSNTASYHYRCDSNIRSEINNGRILTSGYYTGQVDTENNVIEKPYGKCSHGGFRDPSSDQHGKGGINKDAPINEWSPHYFLHSEAAHVAQQATLNIMNEIRDNIQNDELFGSFLGLFVTISASFTLVVDTTGSMAKHLPLLLQSTAASIAEWKATFAADIQMRYILVPFNDPDIGEIQETDDLDEFLRHLASLEAGGGCDTPEPSVGALIQALKLSSDRSPIYVFTDALPSDPHRLPEAEVLITQKSATVSYVMLPKDLGNGDSHKDCGQARRSNKWKRQAEHPYNILTSKTGGRLLNIDTNDLSQIGVFISSATPHSHSTILQASGLLDTIPVLMFPVDTSVEQLIITVTGQELALSLLTPAGLPVSSLEHYSESLKSSTSFRAVINITDAATLGAWQIVLQGSGTYSVLVSALSDLHFTCDLMAYDPSSGYGFSKVIGKPANVAVLQTPRVRSNSLIKVDTINLVGTDGTILQSMDDVLSLGVNTFASNFTPPSVPFQWQIVGKDGVGYSFSRTIVAVTECSDIDLKLSEKGTGFITAHPGDKITVRIQLINGGKKAQFSLSARVIVAGNGSISEDVLEYFVVPNAITVEGNSSADFMVEVCVDDTAPNDLGATFIVVSESTTDYINDYVTFQLMVSTQSPHEVTENVRGVMQSSASLGFSSVQESPGVMMTLLLATLMTLL